MTPRRAVGRPRLVPKIPSSDAREEILSAAATLFELHGYTATSTRAIADEVGLRQASLFHYFARKEDMLTELLDRTVRPTLDLAGQNSLDEFDPDVALWLLAHEDVANLCSGPNNLGTLQLLPEVRSPEFEWFWRRRRKLFRVYSRHIDRGIASGDLPAADGRTTCEVVFGLVESVITATPHFRRDATTPAVIADATLRVCGVSRSRIRRIPDTFELVDE